MKTDKFHSALLDAIEQNQDIDPRQVFGQILNLILTGSKLRHRQVNEAT